MEGGMSILLYEKKDHLVSITLNRPERLNALSRDLADAVVDSLVKFDGDPDSWVCIITGAGEKSFSAGADLRDERHHVEPEKWESAFVRSLTSIKKPMIAAVNGHCLGGGLTVALACDIRIASENASFGTPDQKLNTIDCMASLLLGYLVPPAVAMEILFTGDPINAEEARRTGLVNRVVPRASLMEEAEKIAAKICWNGPLALRACKELSRRGRTLTIDEGVALFEAMAATVLRSEDTREGVMAFLEKRKPVWKGR
jgi:enoyl-CoA hydratase/carnithine racemase